jgi:hypothetical protein
VTMKEKKKVASSTTNLPNYEGKDTNSSRNIRAVRKLFLSGDKFTARRINELVGFNDARKAISELRHKEGMNIQDIRLSNGCKLYWLAEKGGHNE